jgi:hypothetical protein
VGALWNWERDCTAKYVVAWRFERSFARKVESAIVVVRKPWS